VSYSCSLPDLARKPWIDRDSNFGLCAASILVPCFSPLPPARSFSFFLLLILFLTFFFIVSFLTRAIATRSPSLRLTRSSNAPRSCARFYLVKSSGHHTTTALHSKAKPSAVVPPPSPPSYPQHPPAPPSLRPPPYSTHRTSANPSARSARARAHAHAHAHAHPHPHLHPHFQDEIPHPGPIARSAIHAARVLELFARLGADNFLVGELTRCDAEQSGAWRRWGWVLGGGRWKVGR
jgi:hypothetical protein